MRVGPYNGLEVFTPGGVGACLKTSAALPGLPTRLYPDAADEVSGHRLAVFVSEEEALRSPALEVRCLAHRNAHRRTGERVCQRRVPRREGDERSRQRRRFRRACAVRLRAGWSVAQSVQPIAGFCIFGLILAAYVCCPIDRVACHEKRFIVV